MRPALFATLLLLAAPAFADSLSVGPHVLVDGDAAGKAHQLLGPPDHISQEHNRFGATLGETWEYYDRDGKTLRIEVRDGKITAIDESR